MATKSHVRFTIFADGKPRTIFSASEDNKGTVFIHPKADSFHRGPWRHPSSLRTAPKIDSQKYSVHPSPNSPGHNTIHGTTLIGETKLGWHQITSAIKDGKNFALINVRRCSNLVKPHFISETSAREIVNI